MRRTPILIGLGVAVAAAGWYAFRPERLWIDQVVNESFAAGQVASAAPTVGAPTALASGRFHAVAHDGAGTATIYRLADGRRVLRLTEFSTSNGPELRLYLVAASDAGDNETVKKAGFIDLGPLKGNRGDQNYDIPADADLAKYRAVTVWCRRFSVNFTTAPLGSGGDGSATPVSAASGAPVAVLTGQFHSNAHETTGAAAIYQLADGKRVLRLTDFATSNGPDLRVYLVAATDVNDNETVKRAGFIEVGNLKGNRGDQNYDIPVGVDLTKYRAVTIWCRRFSVNFGTAPLGDARS